MKLNVLIRPLLGLILPLAMASCGSTGTADGGSDSSVCNGVQIFKVVPGMYTITSVTNISDECQTGLTEATLQNMMRQVDNSNGTLTLEGSAGPTGLTYGSGPFQCNTGMLKYGPLSTVDGACTYTIARTTTATITADNDIVANVVETDTEHTGTCTPSTDCTTSWTMELKLNP